MTERTLRHVDYHGNECSSYNVNKPDFRKHEQLGTCVNEAGHGHGCCMRNTSSSNMHRAPCFFSNSNSVVLPPSAFPSLLLPSVSHFSPGKPLSVGFHRGVIPTGPSTTALPAARPRPALAAQAARLEVSPLLIVQGRRGNPHGVHGVCGCLYVHLSILSEFPAFLKLRKLKTLQFQLLRQELEAARKESELDLTTAYSK